MFGLHKREEGSRRLFIDAGSNVGQGFDYFKTIFKPSDYTFHFFEPNPNCVKILKGKLEAEYFPRGYELHCKAVWVRDEKLRFFGIEESGSEVTQGGSIIEDHNSSYYKTDPSKALEVDAILFADYLDAVQEEFDELVIKLDIEGAELDVLEDLFGRAGLFRKPVIMFTEFHAIWEAGEVRDKALARENRILASSPPNVRLIRWY